MPRSTTSHKNNVVGIEQLFLVLQYAAKTHCVALWMQTATHGVANDGRLLKNLLHHEMVETSLFDGIKIHFQLLDIRYGLHILNGLDVKFLAQLDTHNLLIFKINNLLGAAYDWGGIRSDVIFTVTNTNHHRASFSGSYQLVGMSLFNDSDGIGTHHMIQSDAHRLKQVDMLALLHIFNEVGEHFCVGG